jgi:hypothetical protein
MLPDWLEPELVLNGTLSDNYRDLYAIYQNTLSNLSAVKVDGKTVIVDTHKDKVDRQYECSFIHFVSKDAGGVRSIDFDRAKKIHWIRPILENYLDSEVKSFWHDHPNGSALYLWLHNYDFLLVLKTFNSSKHILVTAHHVLPYKKRQLRRQYDNSDNKLS